MSRSTNARRFAALMAFAAAALVSSTAGAESLSGTSQHLCGTAGGAPGLARAASQPVGYHHFTLVENQPGTMGPGNLVFGADNGARLRAVRVTGTNASFAPASVSNGGRGFTTRGNGNEALPSAAAGSGQIALGGVIFTSTYAVTAGADSVVIGNDAGVAPTSLTSAAVTGGSDLTYGEYAAALANAINSVFRPARDVLAISAVQDSGATGLLIFANLNKAAPAVLTLDGETALTGGASTMVVTGGLAAVAATSNAVPTKFIDGDHKLVVPYNHAAGTKAAQLTLTDIVLDTRDSPADSTVSLQVDSSSTVSGVTTGSKTAIALTRTDLLSTQLVCVDTSVGPVSNRTTVLHLRVTPERQGLTGNYYAAAQTTDGQWYFMNEAGDFVLYTGGAFPVMARGPLYGRGVTMLSNLNVLPFLGAKLYVGSGLDEADMLAWRSYDGAYLQ